MVPPEHHRGHLPIQSQLCHMFVPLEAPRPFLQLAPLSPGLSSVRGGKSLSPSQVSGSELWIEGTIYRNSPRSESFAALPLYFSHCILGAHILFFSVTFHHQGSWEEGLAPVFPD